MATSGSKSVTVTSWDTLIFSWSVTSQSIANNTSTISWKLQLVATASGAISSSSSKNWSVTVNGTKYSGTNTVGISNNTTKTLASGTTTIAHNSDGTKTFSYSFSQEFDITFSGSSIGTKTGSGTGTLNTIPRKSSISASNGTLGVAQTLTVTRKSSSFTHTITYACGSTWGTIATKSSSTSISWTPPLSLANQNTTGTKLSVTFTIETFNGSTSIGYNSVTVTMSIPSSVAPSLAMSISDATDYKAKFGGYVKGYSKLKIVLTPTLAYSSAIKNYKVTANGNTYSGTSNTVTTEEINASTKVQATVTDARGRTGYVEETVPILNYNPPVISELKITRVKSENYALENINGGVVRVTIYASATPLNNLNSTYYYLEYKKTTETEYTSIELKEDRGSYNLAGAYYYFEAETGSSYNVRVRAVDSITEATKTTVASTGFSLMHWLSSGLGMAIGKIAELTNVFDIGFQTRFMGGILHPTLEPNTDLNDVRTPNTYVGANITTYNYINAPVTIGTFTLEVIGMGTEGQVKQRFSMCRKNDARVFERVYYSSSWGEWVCVSDYAGTLLWSGGKYMTADHVIDFAESASNQPTGIVLVFSEYYDGAAADQTFHSFFISKKLINTHSGKGHCFQMVTSNLSFYATKYLYIRDDGITGHANNGLSGTGANGIIYTNNRFVLRYVIGV